MESIEGAIEVEKFISREILVEISIFWHESNTFANRNIIDSASENFHFSFILLHNTKNTLHSGCFSSTIGPKKTENLPFFDGEIDIVEKCCFPDFFREMRNGNNGLHNYIFRIWMRISETSYPIGTSFRQIFSIGKSQKIPVFSSTKCAWVSSLHS